MDLPAARSPLEMSLPDGSYTGTGVVHELRLAVNVNHLDLGRGKGAWKGRVPWRR
jgi:hypothetical protein